MADIRAVGIDLGTTNSAVAWIDDFGRTAMLRNAEGDILTPSVVLFEDSEVIVGKEARRLAPLYPDRIAEWVKRDMGSPVYTRPIRGEYLPPEVIQACILRKLKADIVAVLGPSTKAVLTVPAYFDEPRRKATADAGEMAGITLMDIVNEPMAAALGFGEVLGYLSPTGQPMEEINIMIYDLGGGTFDATLLRLAPGDIRTLATDGDVQLGGHDWDTRLVEYVAESFKRTHGFDPREDRAALGRLYTIVEEAKHTLSARARATIHFEHAGRAVDLQISREQFEEMTSDLLERTAYTTRQLLVAAKLGWQDVNRLLLVGGSTRMPMVSRMLVELTGKVPDHAVNPDEAVSRGAALYANYLLAVRENIGPAPSFQVTNVNSHSLGVEGIDPTTLRKTNVVLIPRNTPLPAKVTEKFVTKSEGQRSIAIQVLEGESTLPGECTAIGRTVIRDLPVGLPKGWPVEVTFEYGVNGRLTVQAVVPGTHREVMLDLERDVGLSREGISRWKQAMLASPGFDKFEGMLQDLLGPMGSSGQGGTTPAAAPGGAVSAPTPITSAPTGFGAPAVAPMVSGPVGPMASSVAPMPSTPAQVAAGPTGFGAPSVNPGGPMVSGPSTLGSVAPGPWDSGGRVGGDAPGGVGSPIQAPAGGFFASQASSPTVISSAGGHLWPSGSFWRSRFWATCCRARSRFWTRGAFAAGDGFQFHACGAEQSCPGISSTGIGALAVFEPVSSTTHGRAAFGRGRVFATHAGLSSRGPDAGRSGQHRTDDRHAVFVVRNPSAAG